MSILNSLLLTSYSGVWRAAMPLLRRHKRLATGFSERLVPKNWPGDNFVRDANQPVIWIQAASGGEAWLAHSLISELCTLLSPTHPYTFLCTTCTEQGLHVLQQLAISPPHKLITQFFPFDIPKKMSLAINQTRPALIVLLETELWPGMLYSATQANIPTIVLNGRITQKSADNYRLIHSFFRQYGPQKILATSEDDALRFHDVFPQAAVTTMPNIKFDRAASTHTDLTLRPSIRQSLGLASDQPLITFASIREQEEDLLFPAMQECAQNSIFSNKILAIAPRHTHRISAWEERLKQSGIPYFKRSETRPAYGQRWCLWDTFGEMEALYAATDSVFVGGSFAPLGGQNFLEPLAYGLTPCIGPYWENFYWIGEDLFSQQLAIRCTDPGKLATLLIQHVQQTFVPMTAVHLFSAPRLQIREQFLAWLQHRRGGSLQAAKALLDFLG